MWEISTKGQIINSLVSILIGMALSLIYYVFKPIFQNKRNKHPQNIYDALFFLFAAATDLFFFFAVTNGVLRYYIIFFEVVGFLIVYKTVSKYIVSVFSRIYDAIHRIFVWLFYSLQKICEKTVKFAKKSLKILKKLLKNSRQMIYTKSCKQKLEKK